MIDPTQTQSWQALTELAADRGDQRTVALFDRDPERATRYRLEAAGITLDYSKQRIDDDIRTQLAGLVAECGVEQARDAMFAGDHVNTSEDRAAWHVALRAPEAAPMYDEVHEIRHAMADFAQEVRAGQWRGFAGDAITDVVNIGIGGSDLGPRLICESLYTGDGPRPHFVANVDPHDLDDTLARLDPKTTLVIVTSKSFGTAETLANARVARQWLIDGGAGEGDVAKHFVAVSSNREKVSAFGIERMFGFWDWVGGRYSLWSAVGLSIELALGPDVFEALLGGAHAMDTHFREAPVEDNLPIWLALAGIWNNNFLDLTSHCVVPYAQRMANLASFLQQLEMESNGKSVTRDGQPTTVATVPTIWGSVGTNAQHAYFQMLHQGDLTVDLDFVLPLSDADQAGDEREVERVANCLAQAEALMCGRDSQALAEELKAEGLSGDALSHRLAARQFAGNRPSNMLVMDRLDAHHLGALIAAYEHKVFVQGIIWNVNSFDQWGVELGKTMAGKLVEDLNTAGTPSAHDASTAALLSRVRQRWQR
ncbi:glucose-6-phosphate isomerase [Salinisphaera sp. Q1T1-3]|uniref:glucose-6-phosphate isomerase n=1 Tax=Salinisphaera sp. Q1T1-3 TaxID=2321229 RepID=UPI000E757136|nr:glucose-6-phosphate isomerase [Salinisphaera sp. Q1T1-3]RJS93785.1 glucose-6-phosphate isomerase [Salinisphaera sp. Q1T1-3]